MQVFNEKLLVTFGDKLATMVTRVWQPEHSRATVFCIHGFTGNGTDFDYLSEFLAGSGFAVVCPDMIGRGKSTYFRDPKMYTPETYMACIRALSKYAGPQNHFIGSSWGGFMLALFLYLARVKADKLILNDVGLKWTPNLDGHMKSLLAESAAEFDTVEEARAHVRRTRDFLGRIPEALWTRYLDNKIIFHDGKYRLAYDPASTGRFEAMMGRDFNFLPMLSKLATPTLLIYGAGSASYDEKAIAELISKNPNISCVPNLSVGHPLSLMTYDQALLVLGFLNSP